MTHKELVVKLMELGERLYNLQSSSISDIETDINELYSDYDEFLEKLMGVPEDFGYRSDQICNIRDANEGIPFSDQYEKIKGIVADFKQHPEKYPFLDLPASNETN